MSRTTSGRGETIPVVALTGHLGAGKTTLLNHVLRTPRARIGVVINDFGDINVDAGLISGQIDEPASIAGGCICCLPDDGQLDAALARLADPRLRLDAIIVEASGLADPAALARLIGFSEIGGVRDGGVVDVVDAAAHFDTVDRGGVAPARYGAATLVVVNKLDQIPDTDRDALLRRVEARVRERNSRAHIIGATNGRIDPALLYDVAAATDETGQLSFREAMFAEPAEHAHVHAESVTVTAGEAVDPQRLIELLEYPPAGVYRMKGRVAVRQRAGVRGFVVNVVGPAVHIARAAASGSESHLVAIGTHFDTAAARSRMADALRPADGPPSTTAQRRWQRHLTRA